MLDAVLCFHGNGSPDRAGAAHNRSGATLGIRTTMTLAKPSVSFLRAAWADLENHSLPKSHTIALVLGWTWPKRARG